VAFKSVASFFASQATVSCSHHNQLISEKWYELLRVSLEPCEQDQLSKCMIPTAHEKHSRRCVISMHLFGPQYYLEKIVHFDDSSSASVSISLISHLRPSLLTGLLTCFLLDRHNVCTWSRYLTCQSQNCTSGRTSGPSS
jgi:hypothetical protein